jgi:hypothetical protein
MQSKKITDLNGKSCCKIRTLNYLQESMQPEQLVTHIQDLHLELDLIHLWKHPGINLPKEKN